MPGYIQKIRESIDTRLDALAAKADALGAQLASSRREAQARIERRKQALRDSLDQLKKELGRQLNLAEDKRQQLATAIDEFKVQIALGKADALDVLQAQRKQLGEAAAKFESLADAQLAGAKQFVGAAYETMTRRYVQACDALQAEMDAAKERLKTQLLYRGVDLQRHQRELNQKLAQLRQQLSEERKRYAQKWKQFQGEMEPGIRQIAKAFKGLFS